jgi:hypothetical protein
MRRNCNCNCLENRLACMIVPTELAGKHVCLLVSQLEWRSHPFLTFCRCCSSCAMRALQQLAVALLLGWPVRTWMCEWHLYYLLFKFTVFKNSYMHTATETDEPNWRAPDPVRASESTKAQIQFACTTLACAPCKYVGLTGCIYILPHALIAKFNFSVTNPIWNKLHVVTMRDTCWVMHIVMSCHSYIVTYIYETYSLQSNLSAVICHFPKQHASNCFVLDLGCYCHRRSEPDSTPVGNSLQLNGAGNRYGNFSWEAAAPNTFGAQNANQVCGFNCMCVHVDIKETPAGQRLQAECVLTMPPLSHLDVYSLQPACKLYGSSVCIDQGTCMVYPAVFTLCIYVWMLWLTTFADDVTHPPIYPMISFCQDHIHPEWTSRQRMKVQKNGPAGSYTRSVIEITQIKFITDDWLLLAAEYIAHHHRSMHTGQGINNSLSYVNNPYIHASRWHVLHACMLCVTEVYMAGWMVQYTGYVRRLLDIWQGTHIYILYILLAPSECY